MRLELVEGTSKKFWEAELDGASVTVRWGRLGTDGQSKKHSFRDARAARAEHDALVESKLKKGYRRVDGPPAPARDAKLEAAMFARPDDASAALVYADWLQSEGNPWGELITVQHALEAQPKDKALKAREKKLLAALPLPDEQLGTVTWRRGCIQSLHVFNQKDWMDNGYDVMGVLQPLLELPHFGGLKELRTGVIRWESNADDVPAVLAAVAKHPCASRVERLFLGDIPPDVDMDHHVIGDVRALSKQFPNLRELKLHSGAASWSGPNTFEFGPLQLEKLESLVIETCQMSKKRLKQVLGSRLPKLRTLELWFGDRDYGADATLKDLAPLLRGTVFGTVTSLGLKNLAFSNELVAELVTSPWPARLEVLDVSMGTLDAAGVATLCGAAKAFQKLKRLDVSDSYVEAGDVKALRAAFPGVEVLAAEQRTDLSDDPAERYVAVHE